MQCARVVWMQVQAHQCRYHCRWVIVVLHLRELSLSVERTHELWSFNGGDVLQHHCEQATRIQNKKNMCKCNALRLPPPAYHMRKQKNTMYMQCPCTIVLAFPGSCRFCPTEFLPQQSLPCTCSSFGYPPTCGLF